MVINNDGRVSIRCDTSENWNEHNPVLNNKELVCEIADGNAYLKIGDGVTDYANLGYVISPSVPHATKSDYATSAGTSATATRADTSTNVDLAHYSRILDKASGNCRLVVLPHIQYQELDSTHTTSTYLKEFLIYICNNYRHTSDDGGTIYMAVGNPNSQGIIILHMYGGSFNSSNSLPRYSTGLYLSLGGYIYCFGTSEYTFYYRTYSPI